MENLHKRFLEGLEKYGMTQDDLIKEKFVYCGGDQDRHLKYYEKKFPGEPLPEHSDKCVCHHEIKRNFYIIGNNDRGTLILGSCCVKKFIPTGTKRTCNICGDFWKGHSLECNLCQKGLTEVCGCGERITTKYNQCDGCKVKGECRNCGKRVKGTYELCWSCNEEAAIKSTNFCLNCKKPIKDLYKLCWTCNQKHYKRRVLRQDNDESNDESDEPDCLNCRDTGCAYLADDIYGECMNCSASDINPEKTKKQIKWMNQ